MENYFKHKIKLKAMTIQQLNEAHEQITDPKYIRSMQTE